MWKRDRGDRDGQPMAKAKNQAGGIAKKAAKQKPAKTAKQEPAAPTVRMELPFAGRDEWRAWLEEHHDTEREVWVVYFKKHTGKPSLTYDEGVEEALCFGWIDGILKRIE